MALPLVICVGNPARGDDGVAHEVARLLRARDTCAHVVDVHALDVVLAEVAAASDPVIIVDAVRRSEPAVSVTELEPTTTSPGAHTLDAGGLLGVVTSLYPATPRGVLVGVAAPEMPHAEVLSETAREAALQAAETVEALMAPGHQG